MAAKGPSRSGRSDLAGSQVAEDYLKAVWAACEWGGPGASVTGLASRLGVAASTASETVSRLVEAGLLEHEPYRAVTLSETGRERAVGQIRRHRLLETYLVQVLGFGWDEVHAEAEVLEHAVSDRLLERLDAALGHPVRDPHGDPIPQADGTLTQPRLRPLESLEDGEVGVVARIADDPRLLVALEAAGIGLDTPVRLVGRSEAGGASRGEGLGQVAPQGRERSRKRSAGAGETTRAGSACGGGGAVVIIRDGGPEDAAVGECPATVPPGSLWLLA